MATSGQLLQWLVICLLGLAVVMVNSASMSVGDGSMSLEDVLLGRPLLYALLAVAVMLVLGYVDIRPLAAQPAWKNPVVWLLLLSIVLCTLVLVPGIGVRVGGAARWLQLGPASWGLRFQPSELAKWTLLAGLAWWGARQAASMHRFGRGLVPALLMLGAICGLIVVEDLGTAVLIAAVGLVVLLAAGVRLWQLGLLIPPAVALGALLILHSPYRMRRLIAFMDPWSDPQGLGYHPIQSLVAISGGQWVGRGLGNGHQKFGYVPEDTTDFLFAVICEELGIAGAALVIGLYLALLLVGLGVVRDCRHRFGQLLGVGILTTIGLQALMNIAVVTVVIPTKGIALPLLSYGGTGWVTCAGAVGLLAAIDRLNRLEAADRLEEQERPEPRVSAEAGPSAPVLSVSASRAAPS